MSEDQEKNEQSSAPETNSPANETTAERPSRPYNQSGGRPYQPGGHRPQGRPGGDRPQYRSNTRRPGGRRSYYRKKVCKLCKGSKCGEAIKQVDYKNIELLQRFITERGKIIPRRLSGTCAKGQRAITRAIKRARDMALLPYTFHKD